MRDADPRDEFRVETKGRSMVSGQRLPWGCRSPEESH